MTSIDTSIVSTRPNTVRTNLGTMSTDVQEIPSTVTDSGNSYTKL